MQFPAPSETFATNDIIALKRQNVETFIFCLRPKHKLNNEMVVERKLENLFIYNGSLKNIFNGIFFIFIKPKISINFFLWIILKEKRKFYDLIKCFILIPTVFSIFEKINKIKPDIVHLFWGHYPSLVGYLVEKYLKQITLTTFLGAYDLNKNLIISRDVAIKSNLVFSHSISNLPALLKMGIPKKKIKIIHRGIDLKFIDKIFQLSNSFNKGKILTAGKLDKEKRFDLIIYFFKNLIDLKGNFSLDIIGSGPELYNLKKLTKKLSLTKYISFYPHMTQESLFKKMISSEFFILASQKKSERLPNVIKEAMYCECICLSSKSQGIDELIDNELNGFIFDKLDKNLHKVFFDLPKEKLKEVSLAAKEKIIKNFDINVSMQSYKKEWELLINKKL